MRKRLSLLLLAVAMVTSIWAFADAPPGTGSIESTAAPSTPGSTPLRVRGTIERYVVSTRILSLSTANGTMRLLLASTARIRQGSHKLDPMELSKLVGHQAAIGYSESGGNKIVESVHVFGKNERVER